MATAAKRVFILADHAKIGLTSRVGFCPVERIDTLIVDARARRAAQDSPRSGPGLRPSSLPEPACGKGGSVIRGI